MTKVIHYTESKKQELKSVLPSLLSIFRESGEHKVFLRSCIIYFHLYLAKA